VADFAGKRMCVVILMVLVAALALGQATSAQARFQMGQTRAVVMAPTGMVATSQPLAVQLGLEILKKGGNAIDAAVGANAALGLMEPHSCGIGGDLFVIYWDNATRRVYGLNASGRRCSPFSAYGLLSTHWSQDGGWWSCRALEFGIDPDVRRELHQKGHQLVSPLGCARGVATKNPELGRVPVFPL
jgi:hypothetical protein